MVNLGYTLSDNAVVPLFYEAMGERNRLFHTGTEHDTATRKSTRKVEHDCV